MHLLDDHQAPTAEGKAKLIRALIFTWTPLLGTERWVITVISPHWSPRTYRRTTGRFTLEFTSPATITSLQSYFRGSAWMSPIFLVTNRWYPKIRSMVKQHRSITAQELRFFVKVQGTHCGKLVG